jgi:hypothetical protein
MEIYEVIFLTNCLITFLTFQAWNYLLALLYEMVRNVSEGEFRASKMAAVSFVLK